MEDTKSILCLLVLLPLTRSEMQSQQVEVQIYHRVSNVLGDKKVTCRALTLYQILITPNDSRLLLLLAVTSFYDWSLQR